MRQRIELQNLRFGRLVVLGRAEGPRHNRDRAVWTCRCDCGVEKVVLGRLLREGKTRSCGCLRRDIQAELGRTPERQAILAAGKRGLSGSPTVKPKKCESETPLYKVWENMKARCFNPNDQDFHNYGGRGIAPCSDWADSFPAFKRWAHGHGYRTHLTIERIDVNGNYEPENCIWVPMSDQAANRRDTFPVRRSDGKTFPTVAAAARSVGGSATRLRTVCRTGAVFHGFTWGFIDRGVFTAMRREQLLPRSTGNDTIGVECVGY